MAQPIVGDGGCSLLYRSIHKYTIDSIFIGTTTRVQEAERTRVYGSFMSV